jgi:hypothetical protein
MWLDARPRRHGLRSSSARDNTVRNRPDPTNLDHVAYSVVGLGIVGWLVAFLLH